MKNNFAVDLIGTIYGPSALPKLRASNLQARNGRHIFEHILGRLTLSRVQVWPRCYGNQSPCNMRHTRSKRTRCNRQVGSH
jgi:hypothetical protein